MAQLGCSCKKELVSTTGNTGNGKIRAKMTMFAAGLSKIAATSDIREHVSKNHSCDTTAKGFGSARVKMTGFLNSPARVAGESVIKSKLTFSNVALRSRTGGTSSAQVRFTDKFVNKPDEFVAVQKLYPVGDIDNNLNGSLVVNENLSDVDLYSSVDEGIYTGDYTKPSGQSILISDEDTFIQPSSIATAGQFRYKCEVTPPAITPLDSMLVIRASAPTENFQSLGPPKYTLRNITLSDPSGNLIIEYNDQEIIGDNGFSTYFITPKTNNTVDYNNPLYPILGETSDYVLNINIDSECFIDDPFDDGYNEGYQDSCKNNEIPETSLTPTPSLKISAIEINNSGSLVGLLNRTQLPFSIQIDEYGDSISRRILPATILDSGYTSTIWPTTHSVWECSETIDGLSGQNTNPSGISVINGVITNKLGEITLIDTGEVADSGKLNIVFSHTRPVTVTKPYGGDFGFGKPNTGLGAAIVQEVPGVDDWFVVRNIKLKLKAKKAPGSRDYTLDVVGYSDDHILNVTPKQGGFLQSPSGVGSVPEASGFRGVDDLAISAEGISEKDQYFQVTPGNDGGDHYKLATGPVVDSIDYKEYEIPLEIYEDDVILGKSPNYRMASYFEQLYLDIYPLPSGASFTDMALEIEYGPSNALMMHSLGHEVKVMSNGNVVLKPSSMKSVDDFINSNIDTQPLSLIEDIPHAYQSPETIKTNYSRRWRGGNSDIKTGAFDPYAYDDSFDNQRSSHAFNSFYTTFDNIDGDFFVSESMGAIDLNASGQIVGDTFANRLISNIGQRFNSVKKYPSSPRSYNSIDYAGAGHVLEGRITDGFSNAVIVGSGATLNYGSHGDVSQGFSAFARFTPDAGIDVTTGFHRILDNYDGSTGFRVVIANGFFRVNMYDDGAVVRTATDTHPASGYSYPVSLLATYSEHGDQRLRLYADNELAGSGWSIFRDDQASPFTAAVNSGDVITDGNFIMSEVGLSVPCNVVASGADSRNRQTTVDALFDSVRMKYWQDGQTYLDDRYKLWSYTDDDINGWHIGAFNYEQFNQAFDRYTQRGSQDYLIHSLTTDGSAYSDITDIALPTNINTSGISYHSQIENDMLRFNISEMADTDAGNRFWSSRPRISKAIPRNYKFQDRAFVVESVVEHESDVNIPWPWDGYVGEQKFGPKIVVSLYSRKKDPTTHEEENWGLISRKSHYVHPVNDSLIKLSTTFDYDDLIDTESEPWASFNQTRNTTELAHKYYTDDINEMFVQYDIVYPSDTAFTSKLKLHTVHIGLEDALLESDSRVEELNLYASGEAVRRGTVDLSTTGYIAESGIFNLMTSGTPLPSVSGDMPLFTTSAYFPPNDPLPMYTHIVGSIGFGGGFGSLFGAAATPILNMGIEGGEQVAFGSMSLVTEVSNVATNTPSGTVSMFTQQDKTWKLESENIPLYSRGVQVVDNRRRSDMTLNVSGSTDHTPSGDLNLFIGSTQSLVVETGSLGLFSVTNTAFDPSEIYQSTINWTGDNVGEGIDFADQEAGVAFLDLDDEIRGVQTLCWGDCDNVEATCIQEPLITHGVQWFDGECIQGGVARALTTYTNLEASGFKTPEPYINNFYGLRKYTGLRPNSLYDITITGRTASSRIIDVPAESTEWEYGVNDNVAYSGVKLTGDDPVVDSGRNIGDHYGKAVEVASGLMFVGAPHHTISDSTGYALEDAGTVFVYRRQPEPSGADWSQQGDKAGWDFEEKLELPEGFKRDTYTDILKEFPGTSLKGTERVWSVGQEGRNFGHAISASVTDREIVAVSAPNAKWTRTFPDLETEPVNVALFVVTNEFRPTIKISTGGGKFRILTYEDIKANLEGKDVEFTYFADPSTKFNVKIIIVEPLDGEEATADFAEPKPEFIEKVQIDRHLTYDRLTDEFRDKDDVIYQQLIDIYHEKFPLVSDSIHSGIPPILGMIVDDSASLRERAVQPATDRFLDYWQKYTFDNGLRDFSNNPASGYVSYLAEANENWIDQSNEILNDVLSTGNMITFDYAKLFANGVGPAFYQDDVSESNTPAASGGAVFVFEKFDNGWCPIQRIDSPTVDNTVYPDHFGHSVDISKDGSSLIIGSPYIDEAVQFFERDDTFVATAEAGIGSWLDGARTTNAYLATLYQQYLQMVDASGEYNAGVHIYNTITPSGRYQYILDTELTQYNKTFSYSYNDNYPVGNWDFMTDLFMGSQRLGYSVAVNESGTIIAAGSPTDSMNIQNSIPLWYRPGQVETPDGWYSSVNAGSVSVWNTRQFYPHNKAVEYGRFGNLHEIVNRETDPSGSYDHMGDIYSNIGVEFERMPFSVVDIPEDAGLMYLITPASGALSDEILDNIEDWLALGDRHLVVVGNDPVYESSGVYLNSNNIVNDLLRKLDSRMVIQPARNPYEACISGVQFQNNATEATQPAKDVETISLVGAASTLVGSGYGDIKLYDPEFAGEDWTCSNAGAEDPEAPLPLYWELNNRCNMEQMHLGDLRAGWNDVCYDPAAKALLFTNTLAYGYGTYRAGCDSEKFSPPYKPFHEPRAIMAAAEIPPPYEKIIRGTPEQVEITWEYVGDAVVENVWRFPEVSQSGLEFLLTNTQSSGITLNRNLGLTPSPSRFIDPDFYNQRDGFLQGVSTTDTEEQPQEYIYQNPWTMIAEESYGNNGSSVVLMSTVVSESKEVIDSNDGDINQNLYANLVGKNSNGQSIIAQLGGWTNRQGFKSGYDKSVLHDIFRRNGNQVYQNVSMDDLTLEQNGYNVAWVANSSGVMTEDDVEKMKAWLGTGNKKLVITFGHSPEAINTSFPSPEIAQAVVNMCDALDVRIRPAVIPGRNKLARVREDAASPEDYNSIISPVPEAVKRMDIAQTYVGKGFTDFDSSISTFNMAESLYDCYTVDITDTTNSPVVHASLNLRVSDDRFINVGIPELVTGTARADIPVIPGSGYRLFFTTVAESPAEQYPLQLKIANAYGDANRDRLNNPAPILPEGEVAIEDLDYVSREMITIDTVDFIAGPQLFTQSKDPQGTLVTRHIDFLAPANVSGVSVYLWSTPLVERTPISPSPRTPRVVAISGAFCPLELVSLTEPVYEKVETIIPAVPDTIEIVQDDLRQISTGSTKYCPEDNDTNPNNGIACSEYFQGEEGLDPLIADGPVVVAQEIYFNRAFEAGENRSRITVISDASLVQGASIITEEGRVNSNLARFLQRLYPASPEFTRGGKQFVEYEKIVSLERTSPQKLYANTGNSGIMMRFQGTSNGVLSSGRPLLDFSDDEQTVVGKNSFKTLAVEAGDPPVYTVPWDGPERTPEEIAQLKQGEITKFDNNQYTWGGTAKFSGVYEGTMYADASPRGGVPEIMKQTGHDYLDFDKFPSGYPGDLFGYSISLFGKKLIVGAPFVAWESEQFTDWEAAASGTEYLSGSLSGTVLGHNGGAGAAYLYELNADENNVNPVGEETRWGMTRKFRPSSINTGQDLDNTTASQAYKYLGLNNYTEEELKQLSTTSDMFGYDVDIEYDLLVISAPGHDFGNGFSESQGAFQRKSFNTEFDIQTVTYTDLGASGVRDELSSGNAILNNGAVYSYQNNIVDWGAKELGWEMLQKVTPQGYNASASGASENDYFGTSVSLHRGLRVDGDYTMAVGTPLQDYGTSGNAPMLTDAGATYTYEAMLRRGTPAVSESGSWIHATVYGQKPLNSDSTFFGFYNGTDPNKVIQTKGRVLTDQLGQIFLEASGQDMAEKGYVDHRPYIEAVQGFVTQGEEEVGLMRLFTDGRGPEASGDLNLYVGSDTGTVYNNIGLYTGGILGYGSGNMSLVAYNPSGILHTSTVNMVASGAGLNTTELGLRTRGK